MASLSGNSATSSQIQNSGSEGDLQHLMDERERKRKRMVSNRESARRSRMRKQKHLDDLMAQVSQLKNENHQILSTINVTSQQYLNLEAENSVLRAQMGELSQRLESLNEIGIYMNALGGVGCFEEDGLGFGGFEMGDFGILNGFNNGAWTMGYLNQQQNMNIMNMNMNMMASTDVLQC